MEEPIFLYKSNQYAILLMDVIFLIVISVFGVFFIIGMFEKDWLLSVIGLIFMFVVYFPFITNRKVARGYVAVYSNKIIEKKKITKEVKLNDVIEVRYIKKEQYVARNLWYIDYLQFYVKNQEEPILIQPSFGGTVAPYNMREETKEILTYIRVNLPNIKITKEK